MRRSLFLLTTCFLCLTACFPALSAERTFLAKGAPAPYDGYLFDVEYGKAVATGWAKAEADAKTWQAAYEDLRHEVAESTTQQQYNTDVLKDQIAAERRNARRKTRRTTIICILLGGAAGAILHNNL